MTNYSAWLINSGEYVVFSPITHSHPIVTQTQHISAANYTWDFWKKQDLWFLSKCDEIHILMLEDWKDSVGVTAEIEFAKENGKAMRYIDPCVCGIQHHTGGVARQKGPQVYIPEWEYIGVIK